MPLRVCFINFWPGAFTDANSALFLPYVFGEALGELEFTLGQDFHPAALLNYQEYLDMSRFVDLVRLIDNDPQAFAVLHAQPLLLRRPSLEPLCQFLRSAVEQIRRSPAG